MRHVKIFCLIVLSLLLFSSISVRKGLKLVLDDPGNNYFDNYENYFLQLGFQDDNHESGVSQQINRELTTWLPRLTPSGDIIKANQAINKYNCAYAYKTSEYQPHWSCVGPTGKPSGGRSTGNGQIHRLVFDPGYDGVSNFTMYCISNFGGVWMSNTAAVEWKNLNTDVQLPFTTVADMDVHPSLSNLLLLATGDGDYGRIYNDKTFTQISGYRITPTQTSGIYRSEDGGSNWDRMNGPNNDLCHNFSQGGNMRRIKIHPYINSLAFAATTDGIYRSNNVLDRSMSWQKANMPIDTELRGIEIKPDGVGHTIYASGADIYQSDDLGIHWKSITGPSTGLDLKNMPLHQSDFRINVGVTPADPERVYAYIFGINSNLTCEQCKTQCKRVKGCNGSTCVNKKRWAWAYVYKDGKWSKIFEKNTCNPAQLPQRRWLAIAASPTNPNNVFFGTTVVWGNNKETTFIELISGKSFNDVSGYNSQGLHADVHALSFEPKNLSQPHPRLFAGTHGGVSVHNFNDKNGLLGRRDWKRIDHGLQVSTIWDFGQSFIHPEKVIIATQDNGVIIHKDQTLTEASKWKSVLGGDGYGAMFDGATDQAWIRNQSTFYRFDYDNEKKYIEDKLRPHDPRDKSKSFMRYLNGVNHPETGNLVTAFGELYERENSKNKPDQSKVHWKIKSDIGKKVGAGWKREIYSFDISASDPNYMYIISTGNDGVPPINFYTEPRIFRSTQGGCQGMDDYGDPKGDLSCFEEISTDEIVNDNPGDTRLPFITSMAIHESNPNKIWVCFSGYDDKLKVWEWQYDPSVSKATWKNMDPGGSLNNLPVNFLVHQKGTDNRLYIGTDAGIWIKDENEEIWEKYGNFPNVRVTGLHANYCSHQLVAATFGRGVWLGEMLPMINDFANELIIHEGERQFWVDDRAVHRNVRVKANGVLKIDNCVVSMSHNTKIDVEAGGTLILSNAILTNNCGKKWFGINRGGMISSRTESGGKIINHNAQILLTGH